MLFVVTSTNLSSASAQQKVPQRKKLIKVVVSNHFQHVGDRTPPKQQLTAFRQASFQYIATTPSIFSIVPDATMHTRLSNQKLFKERLELAKSLASEGVQSYKELKLTLAMSRLEKSLKQYDAIHYDLIKPREVARVMLYLSLIYLEKKTKLPQTMALMRRMILLDPSLELKRGYYKDNVVDVYDLQRRTLLREMRQQGPGLEFAEQARFLAQQNNADFVVMGFVYPGQNAGHEMVLYLYSQKEGRFERGESALVSDLSPQTLKNVGDRLMSRYAACMHEPVRVTIGPAPSKGMSPLSISLRMAYFTFLTFPDTLDDNYDNIGIGLGARWLLTQEFGVVGGVDMLISRQDREADKITVNHPIYRGFLGGEIGVSFSRLRLGFQLAAELTHITAFSVWGEKDCKIRPGCNDSVRIEYDTYGLIIGLNARPVVSFKLLESLNAFGSANASFFVYTGEEKEFNFPLGGEFGVQYRF